MRGTIALGEPAPALSDLLAPLLDGLPLADPAHADVLLWPAHRRTPLPVGPLNVVDLRTADPAEPVDLAGAGLLLVASATAYGAWALRAGPVPLAVVPPAILPTPLEADRLTALHLLASPDTEPLATEAADWAALQGLPCGIAEGALDLVARLGPAPPLAPGAVALDLRTGSGRIDASPALLALLAAGTPILFAEETPLRLTLEAASAAWRVDASVEAALTRIAGLGTAAFSRATAAATAFVAARFTPAAASAAFARAVDAALARAPSDPAPGGHVLVLSDEAPNLRHVRVHQPFDALHRRGAIDGYTVLSAGAFAFSTHPVTPETRFSAVWVQRSVDPQIHLLLRALARPFVYDLDDDLLVSPSYRPPFAPDALDTAAALVRDCTVFSGATLRLARGRSNAIHTPNLAYTPPRRTPGPARHLVWASSDVPALDGSRLEVERAVRDFCRAHGLTILCLGNPPPPAFAAAGLRVEHVGLLPYPAYLARLRAAAPGILVAPLETGADPATQAFVDAKSDIKIIEARLAGLVGVFSRATPYADSDLAPEILCDNDYGSWLAGLARAACPDPAPAPAWPARRDAAGTGLRPWAEALRRARTDLAAADVTAALRFLATQRGTPLHSPAAFDEADYLSRHPDVAAAVATGTVPSGYRHYVQFGFREGRIARETPTATGQASFWWARLLNETGTLEATVHARRHTLATLADRVALRRRYPEPPPVPAPPRLPPSWLLWDDPATHTFPCPVCDAPGPYPVAVRPAGATLLACTGCGTRFYTDRTPGHYAAETTDAALRFALEQNAGIHHQTRLLFGPPNLGSVLDVGCGFGFAVDMAATLLGCRAVGIDPAPIAAAGRALLGADIRQEYLGPDTDLGLPFDRVIASEVLEHVPDPYALLALLRAHLAPGGTLALTTPNAAAIQPGADAGRLFGILAPGIHLTLFTEASLALALRHAGFAHVAIHATADTLVAQASDRPLLPDAAAAHGPAYRAYLDSLLARATPGTPLWNGAAARLLALLAPAEDPAIVDALFDRVAATWRDTFGLDLAARDRPPALAEADIARLGVAALARRQPFGLAAVLLARARLEHRRPAPPETVLDWAAPAYRIAVETRRVLQGENMIDLDLKHTAWNARLLMLSALCALAPDLEGTLRAAAISPGRAADWDDAPPDAVAAFVAPFFVGAVAADRFDDARRVAPWLNDAALSAGDPALLRQVGAARARLADADRADALTATG